MPAIPFALPSTIPTADSTSQSNPPISGADPNELYDIAIGGVGFMLASTVDQPMVRETAPYTKDRIDQASTPGEQTLTGWWIDSQESFHGGAGQLNLRASTDDPVSHFRFQVSKNIDPFVPSRVRRLPDTAVVSTAVPTGLVSVSVSGSDAVVFVDAGTVKLLTGVLSAPTTTPFATATGVVSVATDGRWVYAASTSTVWKLDPELPATAAVTLATFTGTNVTLGWAKSRLMMGVDNAVYEVDVTTTGVALGASQLRYTHPNSAFVWRAFTNGPQAVLAAGDGGGISTITAFNVQNVSGAPVLQVAGDIGEMPVGERILSLRGVQGSFLAIGTTRGVRIGTYDAYYGRLSYGPLHLSALDPIIPCNAIVSRDRFVYAVGQDYDEAGLLALDLGTQTDQAGRCAWAPSLIGPTSTPGQSATMAAVLPVSNRIVFAVPTVGIVLEGDGPGTGREAWLKTSRIRFGTTEPKLFKLGRVRGSLASGEVQVTGSTPENPSESLATVGFVLTEPDEFRLPSAQTEWLQLQLKLLGSSAELNSYGVKALPGTRRQLYLQPVVTIADNETTKTGQRIRDELSARSRLSALEELASKGDEVLFQEFTPDGVVSVLCVIEKVSFREVGRPTRRSDIGGTATVTLRTVES